MLGAGPAPVRPTTPIAGAGGRTPARAAGLVNLLSIALLAIVAALARIAVRVPFGVEVARGATHRTSSKDDPQADGVREPGRKDRHAR